LNDLKRYLLYFSEENPKQLDQDEVIAILNPAKAMDYDLHEETINASVSYFKHLESLKKIRHINGPNPSSLLVDKKEFLLPVV
jgi:hypothetical protein